MGVGCGGPAADGSDPEPDTSPCDVSATGGGVLTNEVSDIDFSDATVTTTLTHKSDIDSDENGCLAKAEFDFVSDGCSLNLVFDNPSRVFYGETTRVTAPWSLASATVVAGDRCPGWPDNKEGTYRSSGYNFEAKSTVTNHQLDVMADLGTDVCIRDAAIGFSGTVVLRGGQTGEQVVFDLAGLAATTDAWSRANGNEQCPGPEFTDEVEPNGLDGEAIPIAIGQMLTGAGDGPEIDRFRFQAEAGATYRASLFNDYNNCSGTPPSYDTGEAYFVDVATGEPLTERSWINDCAHLEWTASSDMEVDLYVDWSLVSSGDTRYLTLVY
jgi:hypothetical protein